MKLTHSSPSTVEVKNVWSYASFPPICLHDVMLVQQRCHFYSFVKGITPFYIGSVISSGKACIGVICRGEGGGGVQFPSNIFST